MNILAVKTCTKCGAEKPATSEFFNKSKNGRYGLCAFCRLCNQIRCNAYVNANLEKMRANSRAWNAANPERVLANVRNWSKANPGKVRAGSKVWRRANVEKENARTKAWRKANPEKVRQYDRDKRARRNKAQGTHTAEDVARQFDAQKGMCWWCGAKLKKSGKGKYHVDHVVALSKGGSNGPENLVCSCPTCNLSKHARSPLDFAGRLF